MTRTVGRTSVGIWQRTLQRGAQSSARLDPRWLGGIGRGRLNVGGRARSRILDFKPSCSCTTHYLCMHERK